MIHPEMFLNRSLRQYIGSQEVDDQSVYISKRRIYKTLVREKQELHSLKVVAEIERNFGGGKLFWKNIKILSVKRKLTTSISKDDWYEHLVNVCNFVNTNSEETRNNIAVDIKSNQIVNNQGVLNCIITHEEICTSNKNLKKVGRPRPSSRDVYLSTTYDCTIFVKTVQ